MNEGCASNAGNPRCREPAEGQVAGSRLSPAGEKVDENYRSYLHFVAGRVQALEPNEVSSDLSHSVQCSLGPLFGRDFHNCGI
jgi:hypothetical protein